jgi:DUF218 domain
MSASRTVLLGLVNRKERWGLSWRGWLLGLGLALGTVILVLLCAYPFLAITEPVHSDVLVVEGWVHPYAITKAVEQFKAGTYRMVYSTGGPVAGFGGYTNDYSTSANIGAGRLRAAGIPAEFVQAVPSRVDSRDRTYAAAVALRNWFREHNQSVPKFDILTEDAHARRSRLLYEKAFGKEVAIGIIAVPNPDYDSSHWWRYSEGVRTVISEAIAYVYARIIFKAPAAGITNSVSLNGSSTATSTASVGLRYSSVNSPIDNQVTDRQRFRPNNSVKRLTRSAISTVRLTAPTNRSKWLATNKLDLMNEVENRNGTLAACLAV